MENILILFFWILAVFFVTLAVNSATGPGGLLYFLFKRIHRPLAGMYENLRVLLADEPTNYEAIFALERAIRKAEFWRNPLYLCSECQSFWLSLPMMYFYGQWAKWGNDLTSIMIIVFMSLIISGMHAMLNKITS